MIFSNNANLLHFDWCELMSVLHMMFFCKYHCSVTIGACFSMPNCRIFFPLLSQFNAHEFSCNVPSYSFHRIYFPISQKHVAMSGTLPPCGSLSYFCFCFEKDVNIIVTRATWWQCPRHCHMFLRDGKIYAMGRIRRHIAREFMCIKL